MTRPWAIVVGVATLLAIGTATTLNAQSGFQDAFRDGMAAFEQRRWAAAATQFQRAAQLKPESGENVRLYGMRFESYLPQFFLGRALYELGDLSGAVRAFDASEQASAVKGTRYYQALQNQRRDAQKRLLAAAPAPVPAPAAGPPVSNPSASSRLPRTNSSTSSADGCCAASASGAIRRSAASSRSVNSTGRPSAAAFRADTRPRGDAPDRSRNFAPRDQGPR